MKKFTLLLIALVISLSAYSQKWSITASGAVGGSINTGSFYYHDRDYHYWDDWDDWDNIYRNSKLAYEANLGVRLYALKWLYFQTGVGYARYDNKFDPIINNLDPDNPMDLDKTLTIEGLTVPLTAGFTFPNRSRFYPFGEVGLLGMFTFTDNYADRKFYFGTTTKIGGGFKVSDQLAVELAFNSSQIYRFKRHRERGYKENHRYSHETLISIGGSLGVVVNF